MRESTTSFHTTRWTLVRHAAGDDTEARQALSELCAACYEPVVAYLCRAGNHPEAARELAHEFFAQVLERPGLGGADPGQGRFRTYLLGALKHHLCHRRAHASRMKRGGGAVLISMQADVDGGSVIDPVDVHMLPPDREFDRQWALHILRRATNMISAEWQAVGKAEEFSLLQPFIGGEPAHGALEALATSRGGKAATLRKTISRMRQRFRQHVKACITPTLAEARHVDEEMRDLFAALST